MKILFLAVCNKFNKHSFSVLLGSLEKYGSGVFETDIISDDRDIIHEIVVRYNHYKRILLAFSFTTPNVPAMISYIKNLKEAIRQRDIKNISLIAGGPHVSGAWKQTLSMGFDYAVAGEGEMIIRNLSKNFHDQESIKDIIGLAYKDNDSLFFNGLSPRIMNLDDYPAFSKRDGLLGPIEITRGCPYRCNYCQTSFLMGDVMRHRSLDNIIMWALEIKRRRKNDIRFLTPNAFAYASDGIHIKYDAIENLLKAINDIAGKEKTYFGSFPSEVRPEFVTNETLELLVKYTANKRIIIGGQSGSDRMLEIAHRGHDVSAIFKAAETAIKYGVKPHIDFIFGMPYETPKDRRLTCKAIEKLIAMGAIIHSHFFIPIAGSPWSEEEPGGIDDETRTLIESLSGKALQYGQYKKQIKDAKSICSFRKKFMGFKNE